jgi:sec-independent protein translocase protein TatA
MMIPGLPQVGGAELLIFLFILLLLFGTKRIPSLARSLGSGLWELRKGLSGEHEEGGGKERLSEEEAAKPEVVGHKR